MNRGQTVHSVSEWDIEEVAAAIVDSAIRVHRGLGPGLLESAYQTCLKYELERSKHVVACEQRLPIRYREVFIDAGYRLDMVVDDLVVIENKAVERLLPIHSAQLLTYLKLSGHKVGFVLNWNVKLMKNGIKRYVNEL